MEINVAGVFDLISVQQYQRLTPTPNYLLFISWLSEQNPKIQSSLGLMKFEKKGGKLAQQHTLSSLRNSAKRSGPKGRGEGQHQ